MGSSLLSCRGAGSWGSWLDSGSSDVGAVVVGAVVAEAGTRSVVDARYDEVKETSEIHVRGARQRLGTGIRGEEFGWES